MFANSHKEYLQLLKEKAEFTAGLLLDAKAQLAEEDRVINELMYQNVNNFSERHSVHLLATHTSSLQIGTTKSWQDYVNPLAINTMLGSTYYKLRYIENRVL